MALKAALVWLGATATLFGACCLVMLRFGNGMNAPTVVYPFIAIWGLSALAWPLFAILAFRARNDR
jgi:hypothetical protein